MKTVQVAEATGPALDWLVAKCLGGSIRTEHGVFLDQGDGYEYFTPTVDWAQGGPIIEREQIGVGPRPEGSIWPEPWLAASDADDAMFWGPTPLIAAMRCYVVSKLGDTHEVPEGLT